MLRNLFDRAKMSQVQDIGAQATNKADTVRPGFEVKIRWRGRWPHIVNTWQFYARHISHEHLTRMRIDTDNGMDGESRGLVHFQPTTCYLAAVSACKRVTSPCLPPLDS